MRNALVCCDSSLTVAHRLCVANLVGEWLDLRFAFTENKENKQIHVNGNRALYFCCASQHSHYLRFTFYAARHVTWKLIRSTYLNEFFRFFGFGFGICSSQRVHSPPPKEYCFSLNRSMKVSHTQWFEAQQSILYFWIEADGAKKWKYFSMKILINQNHTTS